ncbi:hypothetical protein [[Erwinia] mediterraneensis]|uniref:hypothetical protein n=1 Tax=[Erwinia] mediterraneensis TaxID=2161819 RepID=UPI0013EEFF4A|nr:hypothetical protein [[Erwinia] mediterraneensis]
MPFYTNHIPQHCEKTGTRTKITATIPKDGSTVKTLVGSLKGDFNCEFGDVFYVAIF